MATSPISSNDDSKVSHVVFVVHGIGQQVEGMGRFAENISTLRQTCKETLFEEFAGESANIKWIGIEWYSLLHKLKTVDE